MTIHTALKLLLGATLGLPIFQTLLFCVASLLEAMGDEGAATFLGRVTLVVGVLWLTTLVALVVTLAIKAVRESASLQEDLDEPLR